MNNEKNIVLRAWPRAATSDVTRRGRPAAVAWRPTSTQAAARHRARIMRHERSARPRSAWPRRGATSIMHAMHAAAMHASQAAWSGSQRAAATWAVHGRGPAPTDAHKHVARNRSSTEPSSQAQATLAVGKHVLELTQVAPSTSTGQAQGRKWHGAV